MLDDTDGPEFSKSLKLKQLAVMANRLAKVMDDTWATYTALFDLIDLDDLATNEKTTDAIAELEFELSGILRTIRSHLKIITLVDEPLPTARVDDFEASVLRDIAGLDSLDFDQFWSSDENEGLYDE